VELFALAPRYVGNGTILGWGFKKGTGNFQVALAVDDSS
jgi:hypothetical protein